MEEHFLAMEKVASPSLAARFIAEIAQLVERATENCEVIGPNPIVGTDLIVF
jgi:hypothetical protein